MWPFKKKKETIEVIPVTIHLPNKRQFALVQIPSATPEQIVQFQEVWQSMLKKEKPEERVLFVNKVLDIKILSNRKVKKKKVNK